MRSVCKTQTRPAVKNPCLSDFGTIASGFGIVEGRSSSIAATSMVG